MDQDSPQPGSTNVLEQDVGCPECGYNLRGLGSDVVQCPECGQTNDVAVLLVRRWDKPWYKAPRYSRLCMPAATAFLAFIGWIMSVAVIDTVDSRTSYAAVGAIWLAIGFIGWSAAMAWVWNTLDKHISAGFALLAHLPIVGYVGGLIFMLFGALMLFLALADRTDSGPESIAIFTVMLLGGILGIVGARFIERLAAKHCIRLYLRRPTTSG